MAKPVDVPDLYAYVGPDQFGSGEVGIKQGVVPAGVVPLVVIQSHRYKIDNAVLHEQLQSLVRTFGQPIQLVRFRAVEVVLEVGDETATRT